MASKLIAIVGVTGNQGASVANVFLNTPGWKVRGITRDPSKASAQTWASKGVEVVAADLDDTESLKKAFTGANVIFGATDFWQHMQSPETHKLAAEQQREPNYIAYDREVTQGKNLVDAAAANVSTLDRFVLSTLSDAKKISGGKITFNLHFDSKAVVTDYLKEKQPELWKKSSLLWLGSFLTNWKTGGGKPEKQEDGSYKVTLPVGGDAKIPFVDPNADTGHFVKALVDAPPQKTLVGAGGYINYNEWAEIFSKVHGVKTFFERQDRAVLDGFGPFGRELADMFQYIDEFGYDGRAPEAMYPWDLKKEGIDVKYTTVEEYIKKEDWSGVL